MLDVSPALLDLIEMPTISIGMPVYNRPELLKQAIDSLLNQTFKDFEILISDNASPNPLVQEMCEEYARRDPRIRYVKQPTNIGAFNNLKYVYENCNSEYFMWAADDDLRENTFIERGVKALNADSSKAAWFCELDGIKFDGTPAQHIASVSPFASRGNKRIELIRYMMGSGPKMMLVYSIFRHPTLREPIEFLTHNHQIPGADFVLMYVYVSRHDITIDDNVLFHYRFHDQDRQSRVKVPKRMFANRHFAGYWNGASFTPYPIMTRCLIPVRYLVYLTNKLSISIGKRWRRLRRS